MQYIPGALSVELLRGLLAPLDRDALLHALVGAGGMLLLAYAAWGHHQARVSVLQLRGLIASGVGFLLSTYASLALREAGAVGIAASLCGSALVLWGGRTLVLERQREQSLRPPRERRAGWPGDWPPGTGSQG